MADRLPNTSEMDITGVIIPDDPLVVELVLVNGEEVARVHRCGIFFHVNVGGHKCTLVGWHNVGTGRRLDGVVDFVAKVWGMDVASLWRWLGRRCDDELVG